MRLLSYKDTKDACKSKTQLGYCLVFYTHLLCCDNSIITCNTFFINLFQKWCLLHRNKACMLFRQSIFSIFFYELEFVSGLGLGSCKSKVCTFMNFIYSSEFTSPSAILCLSASSSLLAIVAKSTAVK